MSYTSIEDERSRSISPIEIFYRFFNLLAGLGAIATTAALLLHATSSIASSTTDVSPEQQAVVSFYQDLSKRDYKSAYALLSPEYQAGTSFTEFISGYRTTIKVTAHTLPERASDEVGAILTAIDRGSDGSTRKTSYRGHWRLMWDQSEGRWRLAAGAFQKQ